MSFQFSIAIQRFPRRESRSLKKISSIGKSLTKEYEMKPENSLLENLHSSSHERSFSILVEATKSEAWWSGGTRESPRPTQNGGETETNGRVRIEKI